MADDILEYWMSVSRELAHKYHIEQFDKSSEMWSWENFKDDIQGLRNRLGIGDKYAEILGIRMDLETGQTIDTFTSKEVSPSRLIIFLFYYSRAKDEGIANEWVKFNALRGSWACRFSFDKEDLNALLAAYTNNREKLLAAFERLNARRVDYGDVGFEVSFLPRVKVLIIFEDADDEFPASVRMLYDKNSIFYLPHEMLGDISWFIVSRVVYSVF